ncbi:MAG: N-formylglutamate amidohydrolase [Alphaproteobacteria bacterium]
MDAVVSARPEETLAYDVISPADQTAAVVVASPHSGRVYPPEFLAACRLDLKLLRKSEDSYVDELLGAAPRCGAPLLRARFPRAYVDPNREPFELDPAMFDDALPDYANTCSPRVTAGLGTIARFVANGEEIYRRKLGVAEALSRIDRLYRPYHEALEDLVASTLRRFGACLLVDGHSMPSVGGPMDRDAGRRRLDFVLGDCHGSSCAPEIVDLAQDFLEARGYHVTRNVPYAGGFTTRHYGRPDAGVHALQIEINRSLYMDEDSFERASGFGEVSRQLGELLSVLARESESLLHR